MFTIRRFGLSISEHGPPSIRARMHFIPGESFSLAVCELLIMYAVAISKVSDGFTPVVLLSEIIYNSPTKCSVLLRTDLTLSIFGKRQCLRKIW